MHHSPLSAPAPSSLHYRPLSACQPALHQLSRLFAESRGPHASLTAVRGAGGAGAVTLTSAAAPLLQGMAAARPGPVRFVVAALAAHVSRWPDAGLLTAHLCTALTAADLPLPRRLVAECRQLLAAAAIAYLDGDACACRVRVDCARSLCALAACVLAAKPACGLSGGAVQHVAQLVLRACLQRGGRDARADVLYVAAVGGDPADSQLLPGVLYDAPHVATYACRSVAPDGPLTVALFDTSLSGDSLATGATVELSADVVWSDAVVAQILRCAERLVAVGVGVLACQRVVHPRVKRFLRQHNVLVIDRLGLPFIHSVQLVTGATVLSDHRVPVETHQLGRLDSVRHRVINGRSYLHLEAADKPVCTLVLHARTDEALRELKIQCIAADGVLGSAIRQPYALMGAGCWQSHLAGYIRTLSCEKRRDWSEELGCLPSQLSLIADDFVRTLEASARSVASCPASLHIDRKPPHHVWQEAGGATCQCGVMTTDDVDGMHDRGNCRVLDPFETSVKAIANAVAISNMAICIEHYVQDNN